MFLVATAFALEVSLSAGPRQTIGDPFAVGLGAGGGVGVRPVDWLAFDLGADGWLLPPDGSDRLLTTQGQRVIASGIAPDLSRLVGDAALRASVAPIRGTVWDLSTRVGVVAGVGVVATHDDGELIALTGDAAFMATQDELHPVSLVGVVGEVRAGTLGGRLRIERMGYVEIVTGTVREDKNPWVAAVDLCWWPRGRP